MKIEHRFSFFIFQLAEKMNDPNIHAFQKIFLHVIFFFWKKNEQKTQELKQGIYNYFFLFVHIAILLHIGCHHRLATRMCSCGVLDMIQFSLSVFRWNAWNMLSKQNEFASKNYCYNLNLAVTIG